MKDPLFARRPDGANAPGVAVIRASEIGQYKFCHRAWWLCRVRGCQAQNRDVLMAGAEYHARHSRSVVASQRWERVGYILLGTGILAAVWAVLQGLKMGA